MRGAAQRDIHYASVGGVLSDVIKVYGTRQQVNFEGQWITILVGS